MSLYETNLSSNYIILSNEELSEKMKTSCATIGKRLYIFKSQLHNCDILLEDNYSDRDLLNTNFDDIELIEENLDELFDKYKKIKSDIANARMAQHYYMKSKKQDDN